MSPPFHPHVGHQSVTYIIEGGAQYEDTFGNEATLLKGDLSWMNAGSGVWHVEFPAKKIQERGGLSEFFQLWLRSPNEAQKREPSYQDIRQERFPSFHNEEWKLTVLAGRLSHPNDPNSHLLSPVFLETPVLLFKVDLQPKATLRIPGIEDDYRIYCYLLKGTHAYVGPENKKLVFSNAFKLKKVDSLKASNDIVLKGGEEETSSVIIIGVKDMEDKFVRRNTIVAESNEKLEEFLELYRERKIASTPPVILEKLGYTDKEMQEALL